MSSNHPLIILSVVALLAAACSEHQPPNIILIMADDMGFETLGTYGNEEYLTPHLDKLAEEGLLFNNCYSTPLCTPSRVKIMTGKYNFRNYIGFGILDSTETTFGHMLKEQGYRTAITGKWQLWGNEQQLKLAGQNGSLPEQAGFEKYLLWQVKDRGFRFKSPTLEGNSGLQSYPEGYGPDLFLDFIKSIIAEPSDQPFFIYYPMVLTHDPFQVTPTSEGWAEYNPDSLFVNDTTHFADNINYADKIIGEIRSELEDQGKEENTLLLFIGDNGTDRKVISEWKGEQIRGRKGFPEEYGTHVPFIAYWNGTITPGTSNSLVDFTDFATTLAVLSGKIESGGRYEDGFDLSGELRGLGSSQRDWIFTSYAPKWGRFENSRWVHDGEFKLYDDSTAFDIMNDPSETENIYSKLVNERPDWLSEMQHVLDSLK